MENSIRLIVLVNTIFVHLAVTTDSNVALNKPVRQWTPVPHYPASKAVDGKLSSSSTDCTHTGLKPAGKPNWWIVNLEARYTVHRVAILNRDIKGERLHNFLVTIWEVDPAPLIVDNMTEIYCKCLHYPGVLPSTGLIDLPCSTNCTGQFVAVILPSDYLTLCEVEVYGQLLDYSPRKSMVLNVIPGKRSIASTTDQTMSPVQFMFQCSLYCLSIANCLSINYVYNATSNSGTCTFLTSITEPTSDIIEDKNSTWLVIRQLTYG